MTKKERRSPYHRNFTYSGPQARFERNRLLAYLEGKLDTSKWREEFAKQRQGPVAPIAYKSRIYPEWAVRDFYQLMDEQPEIFEGCEIGEIPPKKLIETEL